jgi:hypothetical protein
MLKCKFISFAVVLRLFFHFGVLHAVARALSRLSEKPSFATIVQGVYCTYTAK